MKSKFGYRIWQFWQSLKRTPQQREWNQIQDILDTAEMDLFKMLPGPDQNHSLRVLQALESAGETDPDLLKAALLHDIGKTLHPLRRWERIFAVLVGGILPEIAQDWRLKEPRGFHRPLVIIHQHPEWGAELAEKAGSNQRVIWLIRHHQAGDMSGLFDQGGVELLKKLQEADNLN